MRLQKVGHFVRTFAQMWLRLGLQAAHYLMETPLQENVSALAYRLKRQPLMKGQKTEMAAHASPLSKAVLGAGQHIVPHWQHCAARAD